MAKWIYARGNRLYCRLKNEQGKWVSRATPYNVGQEEDAIRYVKRKQEILAERREAGTEGPLTLRQYADHWTKERRERGIGSAKTEASRLRDHVLPHLGSMRLDQIEVQHVRDLVRRLQKEGDLAPRTIIHVYNTLHNLFEDAVIEKRVTASPCKLKTSRRELPKKRDKDPEWRSQAMFTRAEVERLISDPAIPPERRVLYALKAIAGLRHGEAAALRWRHYEAQAKPLGRIIVAVAFDSHSGKEKATKTEDTRRVPAHPTLAAILAAWKLEHWERIYGRKPTDDDIIVPTRTGRNINKTDAARAMREDLDTLGMRVAAGQGGRSRGGHDLRAWYKTQTIEDGADSLIVRRTTHAPPKDVDAGYERFSWAVICREVGKLQVAPRGGKLLELCSNVATAELRARNRWTKMVTPPGLEPGISA